MARAFCKLGQNHEVNLGSLSETMETGVPCSLIISLTYNWANLSNESLFLIGRKWADFVSLSTITHIVSWPLYYPLSMTNPLVAQTLFTSQLHYLWIQNLKLSNPVYQYRTYMKCNVANSAPESVSFSLTPKDLNSMSRGRCMALKCDRELMGLLLRASATTFAFPG